VKSAWKEVTKSEETESQSERNTEEFEAVSVEESTEETVRKASGKREEPDATHPRHFELSEEANLIARHYENARS